MCRGSVSEWGHFHLTERNGAYERVRVCVSVPECVHSVSMWSGCACERVHVEWRVLSVCTRVLPV